MPFTLIVLIAGLVLRFGVNGYNTLGDILIGVAGGVTVLMFLFMGGILAAIARQ